MQSFSPLAAALGGTLIGLAAALLWAGSGRIAGVSGIFGQMLPPSHIAWWRLAFLGGLVLGAFGAARLAALAGFGMPVPRLIGGVSWLAAAGVLTGLGTRIGNGCTSGHGVCGLARGSARSLAAVIVFFTVAAVTVALSGIAR